MGTAVTVGSPDTDLAEALTDLWVDLARGQRDHGSHILPGANRDRIRETILRHIVDDTLFVARDDGLVGFIMFEMETGTYEQDCQRGLVTNLYVSPQRRGEGIGGQLLDAAERALVERGVDVVALEVMADNEAARRFYERAGYDTHRVKLERRVESDTHSKGEE